LGETMLDVKGLLMLWLCPIPFRESMLNLSKKNSRSLSLEFFAAIGNHTHLAESGEHQLFSGEDLEVIRESKLVN